MNGISRAQILAQYRFGEGTGVNLFRTVLGGGLGRSRRAEGVASGMDEAAMAALAGPRSGGEFPLTAPRRRGGVSLAGERRGVADVRRKEWQPARLSAETARWLSLSNAWWNRAGPRTPHWSSDPVGGGWDPNGAWRSRADPRPRLTPRGGRWLIPGGGDDGWFRVRRS